MTSLSAKIASLPLEIRCMIWKSLAGPLEAEYERTLTLRFGSSFTFPPRGHSDATFLPTLNQRHLMLTTTFRDEYATELFSNREIVFGVLKLDSDEWQERMEDTSVALASATNFLACSSQTNCPRQIVISYLDPVDVSGAPMTPPYLDRLRAALPIILEAITRFPRARFIFRVRYYLIPDGYEECGQLFHPQPESRQVALDIVIGDAGRSFRSLYRAMKRIFRAFDKRADAEEEFESTHGVNKNKSEVKYWNTFWHYKVRVIETDFKKLVDIMQVGPTRPPPGMAS